ncbi:hypothetical protein C5B42_02610 [Candidatus Cerribacteria bacterium 'Amazon FNV 2010 28 9']|uniref:Thioredoxin domain-containing protein n=1 Tax=Candidatus Cerribacteria bacterium 'Amazon FNV 2010 28 9' TaxID=2081795 RepID=A0A317JNX6_9BACT|nr:MAG: hypothetical protein C5B42_02610 [Candidatus Cerribacteria bacterium 'Amazon FNV 2010 28 9']
MGILLIFAFISGFVTIAAPCIWPLLPVILSASATGGKQKPLGITIGISLSFGAATLLLSTLLAHLPIDANVLRYSAAVIIALLGVALLFPAISTQLEALVSRLSGQLPMGASTNTKNGFWAGLLAGCSLGLVWAPCAGPIFATIAALAATQKVTIQLVLVTVSYVIGIAIPLFLFATLGNTFFTKKRLSLPTESIQRVFGAVMIGMAILIATNEIVVLEAKLLDLFPNISSKLTSIENTVAVQQQLSVLKNQQPALIVGTGILNTSYKAPAIVGISHWLNSSPLTLAQLKGHVVLIDFWTYTCINCIRTLPHVTSWYAKYKDQGFVVIGVHTPEFEFEKDTGNVQNAIKQFGITYPVAQDNTYATWNAFENQYWPAEYLIDANGNVRRTEFGEGNYNQTEQAIQQLLKEAGKTVTFSLDTMPDTTPTLNISPETYFGANRATYFFPTGTLSAGTHSYTLSPDLDESMFSLGGTWNIQADKAVSGDRAQLLYDFVASKVYAVVRPPSNGLGALRVYLDGKLIDPSVAGSDVKDGVVTIDKDRLYNLVDLHGKTEEHQLMIVPTNGIQLFTITFG